MTQQNITQGLVLYPDGGAKPNPGPAGYGVHGYLYSVEEPKKGLGLGSIIATRSGYREKSRPLSVEEIDKGFSDKPVNILKYVDLYSAHPVEATNNLVELLGATRALELALEMVVSEVLLLCDSKYVVRGSNEWHHRWVQNGWKTVNGEDVANRVEWQRFLAIKDELTVRGITVKLEWTQGHVESIESVGNNKADKLATVGRIRAKEAVAKGTSFNESTLSDPDGYWRTRVERHPLISLRRMYFTTQKENLQEGVYLIGNHGADDQTLGTRTADGAYGVVTLRTPDATLERIRENLTYPEGATERVAALHLDTLYNQDFYSDWLSHDMFAIDRYIPGTAHTRTLSGLPLSNEFDPPMLSWRTMDALSELYHDLAAVSASGFASTSGYKVNEVTDTFYELKETKKNKKGESVFEKQLKPQFNVGFASLNLEIDYDNEQTTKGNGRRPITLTLGVDMPERNTMKNIQDRNPRVYVVAKSVSKESFRYFTIIATDCGVGIYAGIYSNIRIII